MLLLYAICAMVDGLFSRTKDLGINKRLYESNDDDKMVMWEDKRLEKNERCGDEEWCFGVCGGKKLGRLLRHTAKNTSSQKYSRNLSMT